MLTFRQTEKRKTRGFTLTEIIVGTAIITIIGSIVGHWFFMQRSYQQMILKKSDAQQRIRRASWKMVQELKTARTILSPRLNSDKSIRSEDKVFFKNFAGDIVCYYHSLKQKKIFRCLIPNGPGAPVVDKVPVGENISQAAFTAQDPGNRLVSIFLSADGAFGLESVYLMNE
ncbi:MAG: pilus assembly FimT family protein [Candidatus Rifleibacteriota bacterium]